MADCVDGSQNCAYWARLGECKKNPTFMLKTCKRSCGVCGNKKTMLTTTAKTKVKTKGEFWIVYNTASDLQFSKNCEINNKIRSPSQSEQESNE